MWSVSILPFWLLYRISDLLYLIFRLIGYRSAVIMKNLENSFPDKKPSELRDIKNKFYQHFSDLLLEVLKFQTISKKALNKRVTFSNLDYVEEQYDKGRDVVAVIGHYGNWEYVTFIHDKVRCQGCGVYLPLKDKRFDNFRLKVRSRFVAINFAKKTTMLNVYRLRHENTRFI